MCVLLCLKSAKSRPIEHFTKLFPKIQMPGGGMIKANVIKGQTLPANWR